MTHLSWSSLDIIQFTRTPQFTADLDKKVLMSRWEVRRSLSMSWCGISFNLAVISSIHGGHHLIKTILVNPEQASPVLPLRWELVVIFVELKYEFIRNDWTITFMNSENSNFNESTSFMSSLNLFLLKLLK